MATKDRNEYDPTRLSVTNGQVDHPNLQPKSTTGPSSATWPSLVLVGIIVVTLTVLVPVSVWLWRLAVGA